MFNTAANTYPVCPRCSVGRMVPMFISGPACDQACELRPVAPQSSGSLHKYFGTEVKALNEIVFWRTSGAAFAYQSKLRGYLAVDIKEYEYPADAGDKLVWSRFVNTEEFTLPDRMLLREIQSPATPAAANPLAQGGAGMLPVPVSVPVPTPVPGRPLTNYPPFNAPKGTNPYNQSPWAFPVQVKP